MSERDVGQERGWVEIYRDQNSAEVYDWSEAGDSGYLVGTYPTIEMAISEARAWARVHRRKLVSAEILPFEKEAPDVW